MSLLRGIVLRGDDDHLVVQATPAEVLRFLDEQRAAPVTVTPGTATGTVGTVAVSGLLYDAAGLPVAMVTHVDVQHNHIDVTSLSDMTPQFLRGIPSVHLRARGLPGLRLLMQPC